MRKISKTMGKKPGFRFYCPRCDDRLDSEGEILLQISEADDDDFDIIKLPAKIGEYSLKDENHIKIKNRNKIKMFCPICYENLDAKNKHFSKLVVRNGKVSGEIFFSNRAGEEASFLIERGSGKFQKFGKHSEKYSEKDFTKQIERLKKT